MMKCHRVASGGASPVRTVVVLAGLLVLALLWPAQALAQAPPPPLNLLGDYRGFSQSDVDPRNHPSMALTVDRQDEKGNFFGTLEMGVPGGVLPFTFQGKLVDGEGGFKGKGFGEAGEVGFTGVVQDLGDGGLLARARYKFIFPDGTQDQGATDLLRSFDLPPDPTVVMDVVGDWIGTERSDLTGRLGNFKLSLSSQFGTSFSGEEIVGGIAPCTIVGTIGAGGRIVYIGAGDQGRVLAGGPAWPLTREAFPPPDDSLSARYMRSFPSGAVDLGTFGGPPPDDG